MIFNFRSAFTLFGDSLSSSFAPSIVNFTTKHALLQHNHILSQPPFSATDILNPIEFNPDNGTPPIFPALRAAGFLGFLSEQYQSDQLQTMVAAKDSANHKKENSEPTFLESTGTEMVDLIVGKEKRLFRVHKNIICDKVPYFAKMFRGGFAEAESGTATFPEDDANAFDIFIGWVYHGTLRNLEYKSTTDVLNWNPLKVYILAEKLCIPELMDRTIDSWKAVLVAKNAIPHATTIEKCYTTSSNIAILKGFVLQNLMYAHFQLRQKDRFDLWPTSRLDEILRSNKDLNINFLAAMRQHTYQRLTFFPDPRRLPACDHHVHDKDGTCYLSKKRKREN